jgi:uncharacterized cysteine cluster protein YcgN (CxxCxxCC family)
LANIRIAPATTKKNNLSVSDYYSKMCQFADDLAMTGTPLRDDELVAYLLAGLDEEYNSIFTSVVGRTDLIVPTDYYAQLLSFEQHTSLQGQPSFGGSLSAMTASRGGPNYSGGCGSGSSRGSGFDRGRGCGRSPHFGYPNQSGRGSGNANNSSRTQCHVCSKISHTAKKCWYRYEDNSSFEPRTTALASAGATDNNWYIDSCATDHITGDLDKLTMHDPYCGNDQVHTVNGSGMNITRVSNSIIPTPTRDLILNNVIHVPTTHKNLIFVHRFTLTTTLLLNFTTISLSSRIKK